MSSVIVVLAPGFKEGGDGWFILNGKLHRVPPRTPSLIKIRAAMQTLENLPEVEDVGDIQHAAEKLLVRAAEELVEEKVPVK